MVLQLPAAALRRDAMAQMHLPTQAKPKSSMRFKTSFASALLSVHCLPAHAYDWLNDWPTTLKTDEGYEFGIKGDYQVDLNNFSGDTADPVTGKEILVDATTWRRKEFYVYAQVPFGLDATLGYDFAGKLWVDNFLRYGNQQIGDFRLGQFKTPVGWEEAEAATATTFMERSLPVQATNMGRRLGVDWIYPRISNWLLMLAYYRGGDLNGDNDGHGPAARVVFNPIKDNEEIIHLGIAASRENRDATIDGRDIASPPIARFRARAEANLTNIRVLDTGNLKNADNIDRAGLEGAWIRGPLLVQGEYLRFRANFTDGTPTYNGGGYYVSGSWVLTGESRRYQNGYIGTLTPARDYGAFEIAARYSKLDLNDGPVYGGSGHDWTIGANWYLGRHLKIQANYVRAYSTKYYSGPKRYLDFDPAIFELRGQVYF